MATDPNTINHQGFNPDIDVDERVTPFDARDQSGRRAMLLLAGAFAFLLILAIIVFKVYQPGVRDRGEPPRITAENTPFKVKPDNPGGEQTPDQDKVIYDVMDGKTADDAITAAPTPEAPIELPKTANIIVDKPTIKTPNPQAQIPETPRPEPSTSGGDYVVQVASVRFKEDADALWAQLQSDFARMLGGAYADIKRADLGDKGIYYRLRIAGLADKAAANRLCDQLKTGGQACFVAKK